MDSRQKRTNLMLLVFTTIPEALLALASLWMGAVTLFSPDVPEQALAENTAVGATLVVIGTILVYALFHPYSGGILLCICAIPFALVFNGLGLSRALFPTREVGYHPFWSGLTVLIFLLGVLSVIRGRMRQRTVPTKPAEAA